MVTNNTYEYGIKYRSIKINPKQYIMIPVSLIGGLSDGFNFSTNDGVLTIAKEKKDMKNKYVVDNVFLTEELEKIYGMDDDTDTLSEYFYVDNSEVIYLVQVQEDGSLKKYEIDLSKFKTTERDLTYQMDKSIPTITLNEDCLNEILASEDINEIKVILKKYKDLLRKFVSHNKHDGITVINVKDGKITSFGTSKKVNEDSTTKKEELQIQLSQTKEKSVPSQEDVSYQGLKKAIKEVIFGHDDEIDTFAQKLYMNYTASDSDAIESILLVGPTGTGKTETVRTACEYLGIPYFEANAANLVPQGIKGTSLEDVLISLYELSGRDLSRAQKGLVFLDEFDKLNDSDLDLKHALKSILLSFTGGATIPVRDENYDFVFDSRMTNKVYAGVFERIMDNKKTVGFKTSEQQPSLGTDDDIRKKIIDNGYFSLEELSRISTILGYEDLTRAVKKEILLRSKTSEFAKKKERYKRQFGIDLIASDDYIDAILDSISNSATGMRSVNNFVKKSIDTAEKEILENSKKGYKRLVLTKDTVQNPKKFDLS